MKQRKCQNCLYFIDLQCHHVDGTNCATQRVKHPHWRPRPTDKLSPSLREMVKQAAQAGEESE